MPFSGRGCPSMSTVTAATVVPVLNAGDEGVTCRSFGAANSGSPTDVFSSLPARFGAATACQAASGAHLVDAGLRAGGHPDRVVRDDAVAGKAADRDAADVRAGADAGPHEVVRAGDVGRGGRAAARSQEDALLGAVVHLVAVDDVAA